jgi:hypothetical protein
MHFILKYYSKLFLQHMFLLISTNNINATISTLCKDKEVNMFFQLFNFFLVKYVNPFQITPLMYARV